MVARLNELFECIVPIVARHRGHIDQFIGDAVLAVFGAPEQVPQHADRAVQCAVELARTINSRRPGGFEVGIGVNTGKVVAGAIGGAGRLSFGSAERLKRHLGVEPGSVTPLALINDPSRTVRLALDRGLADGGPVNAHPLVNTMTTAVAAPDLLRFFAATGHEPRWLDFPI